MNPLTVTGSFIFGAITMASFVIGLFFLKFYMRTRDRLLASFGIAFLLLGTERVLLMGVPQEHEARSLLYLIRLVAFSLICFAIVQKNRESSGRRPE